MLNRLCRCCGLILALSLQIACGPSSTAHDPAAPRAVASTPTHLSETAHYSVTSTADQASTRDAGVTVEALYSAYIAFFDINLQSTELAPLRIRIYATRDEFQAHNRSRPWAERYYVEGVCHAYLDTGQPNPYHWLLHEAVHQLNRERTGFAKEKWINEGLASYFGSSRYVDGQLELGIPDYDSYPLWWLKRWQLSGDWSSDLQAQRVIALQSLITGQDGPPLDSTVNAHYLAYWSLTHFLLHYDNGTYAAGYRQLIEHGGSLQHFEQHIGPLHEVERAWYGYFLDQWRTARER